MHDGSLAAVRAEGGRKLPFDPAVQPIEQAPDWSKPGAPSVETVALQAATPVTGPGIMPGSVRLQPLSDTYVRWMKSNVGKQKQAGFVHLTARLPLGDFTSGQMRVLADLADAYGDGTMRLTVEQNVLFRWVKATDVEAFYNRLDAAGLGQPDANTLADVVSCPGAESCRLAVTQSRGLGRILTEHLDGHPEFVTLVENGDIKISGCPNGCGQHHIGSIGFQGSVRKLAGRAVPQYFVLVGGGNNNFRIVYLDGRGHQGQVGGDDDNPLYYGRSVGKWEGDALAVDTRGFNEDFWFTNGGLPHTEQLRLLERYTRTDFDTLKYEVRIEDEGAYTRPWSSGWNLRWVAGREAPRHLCQDNRP